MSMCMYVMRSGAFVNLGMWMDMCAKMCVDMCVETCEDLNTPHRHVDRHV